MNYQAAIAQLATLLALPDQVAPGVPPNPDGTATKAQIIKLAQDANLDSTAFIPGDPAERFLEITARVQQRWGVVPVAACRGAFFALSTDPGDVDDFGMPDQANDQTPRPGWLSALGQGLCGVTRGGQTYATCFVTIKNNGASPATFSAGQLVLEASTIVRSDGGTPTYVTVADPAIYSGPGATLTLAAGASKAGVPVQAQQLGSYGSAALNLIDTCVTTTFGTIIVTASSTAIGQDRQARSAYIAMCLAAPSSRAPGGPGQAYVTACTLQRDPTSPTDLAPLQRFDGSGPVNITQVQVTPASALNEVTVYVGGLAGLVDDIDVTSATANVLGILVPDANGTYWNPQPMGVLPDTVTLLPTASDPNLPAGTPGVASVVATPIPIGGLIKVKQSKVNGAALGGYYAPWVGSTIYIAGLFVMNGTVVYQCTTGGTSASSGGPTGTGSSITDGTCVWQSVVGTAVTNPAPVLALRAAIGASVNGYFLGAGVGGLDQTNGSGFVYQADVGPAIVATQAGLYDPIVAMATSTVAIAVGHIATLAANTLIIAVVPG